MFISQGFGLSSVKIKRIYLSQDKMTIFGQRIAMKPLSYYILAVSLVLLTSCAVRYKTITFSDINTSKIDYNSSVHWAVFNGVDINGNVVGPSADSLKADVFFVYPTLFTDKKDSRWNASVTDSVINADVLKWVIPFQAAAWADAGRLFVPYYRQNHYRAFFEPYLEQGGLEAQIVAYNDIKNAFDYYLEHINNGRPILLAGHSQGAIHLKRLLKDYFDGTSLQKQLVAAYLVGARVKADEFTTIKPLTTPDGTGGFVSWNSYKMGSYPKYYNWYKDAITTNPVTWNEASRSDYKQHKGLLYYDQTLYPKCLEVEVKDGLLWTSLPKVPKRFWVSFVKDYHRFDITFFWKDINENAKRRVVAFLEK